MPEIRVLTGTVVNRSEKWVSSSPASFSGYNTFTATVIDDNGNTHRLLFKSGFQNAGRRPKPGTSREIVYGGYFYQAWCELQIGVRIRFEVSDANKYEQTYVTYRYGQESIYLHYRII